MKVFNTYEDMDKDIWYCIPNGVYYFSIKYRDMYKVSISTRRFNEWLEEGNLHNKFTKVKVGATYD